MEQPTYYVPAGPFIMGSGEDDPLSYENERPQRSVDIDDFWIMETEVTNAQYSKCVKAGICPSIGDIDDPKKALYPVSNVNWDEANTYATWAGGRLPTEAQWEKACRGTAGQLFPWGNESPNYERASRKGIAPVGSYPQGASPYGALDMSGNVWEWTWGPLVNLGPEPDISVKYSFFNDEYHFSDLGHLDDGTRIMRGGGGYDAPEYGMRCAIRKGMGADAKINGLGFRVVRISF